MVTTPTADGAAVDGWPGRLTGLSRQECMRLLGSVPPRPVRLGARWIRMDHVSDTAGSPLVRNPIVPLPPVLHPGTRTRAQLPLEFPARAGRRGGGLPATSANRAGWLAVPSSPARTAFWRRRPATGQPGEENPSDDERWQGASSLHLLERAYDAVRQAGFELVNADCVLVGERPRVAGRRAEMEKRLTGALGVEPGRVVGDALSFLLEARLDEGPMSDEEAAGVQRFGDIANFADALRAVIEV